MTDPADIDRAAELERRHWEYGTWDDEEPCHSCNGVGRWEYGEQWETCAHCDGDGVEPKRGSRR